MVLQDPPIHMIQQLMNGIWAWVVAGLGSPASLLCLCHQGQLSCLAQASDGAYSPKCYGWASFPLSHAHAFALRASSFVLARQGLFSDERQG